MTGTPAAPVPAAPVPAAKPLRKDAAANRERVLTAAAEVFSEQGLAAGLEDVARRAGVGVATVYRRFSSREALLEALLAELLDSYSALAADALTLPAGQGLSAYLRAAGEVQATPLGVVLRLWTSAGGEQRRAVLRAQTQALLADAQRAGTCRADVTVDDVVGVFVALRGIRETLTDGVALDWHRHLELCLAGLRP